ncbi:MAG: hypothetical protein CMP11_06550 [Zetaproteobacteria bacterium]|nr:hypothetical protein [Pseudobdellovibrionaceae bacterium]
MTSKLSEELDLAIYERGYQSFLLKRRKKNPLFNNNLDSFHKALASDNPQEEIQSIDPQSLYYSIKNCSPETQIATLPLISKDQLTRLFDYDVWTDNSLNIKRVCSWLSLLKQSSATDMLRKFNQLEEEYRLAILSPLVQFITQEEFEKLGEQEQDTLFSLPGEEIFYKITTDDKEIQQTIQSIIETAMGTDMNYTISLLAHASYLSSIESEELIARFRRARMEEDGFVTYEESLGFFKPINTDHLIEKWKKESTNTSSLLTKKEDNFLETVIKHISRTDCTAFENIEKSMTQTMNALCSVSQIESSDLSNLETIYEYARGSINLALEFLSNKNIDIACEILKKEYTKSLFCFSASMYNDLRKHFIQNLEKFTNLPSNKLKDYLYKQKNGQILKWFDTNGLEYFGFERNETLKGLFNRFPVVPFPENTGEKLKFKVLSTLEDYEKLVSLVNTNSALLYLSFSSNTPLSKTTSLDKIIQNASIQAICGNEFKNDPIRQEQVEKINNMDQDLWQKSKTFLLSSINILLNKDQISEARESYVFSKYRNTPDNYVFLTVKEIENLLNEVQKIKTFEFDTLRNSHSLKD